MIVLREIIVTQRDKISSKSAAHSNCSKNKKAAQVAAHGHQLRSAEAAQEGDIRVAVCMIGAVRGLLLPGVIASIRGMLAAMFFLTSS